MNCFLRPVTLIFFALACMTVLLFSCGEDEEEPVNYTREQALLTYNWNLVSWETVVSKGDAAQDTVRDTLDNYASLELCERDNYYNFSREGSYTYYANNNICSGDQADVIRTGTWSGNRSLSRLTLDSIVCRVKTLNAEAFVLSYEESQGDVRVTHLMTYRSF